MDAFTPSPYKMAIDPDILHLGSIFQKNMNVPFVQRLQNRNVYQNIPWGEGYASHQMSYAEVGGKYIVYPEVESFNGKISHLPSLGIDPVKYALEKNNFIEFDNEEEASWFTKNYKKYWGMD